MAENNTNEFTDKSNAMGLGSVAAGIGGGAVVGLGGGYFNGGVNEATVTAAKDAHAAAEKAFKEAAEKLATTFKDPELAMITSHADKKTLKQLTEAKTGFGTLVEKLTEHVKNAEGEAKTTIEKMLPELKSVHELEKGIGTAATKLADTQALKTQLEKGALTFAGRIREGVKRNPILFVGLTTLATVGSAFLANSFLGEKTNNLSGSNQAI